MSNICEVIYKNMKLKGGSDKYDHFASSRMTEGGLHQDGGAWGRKEERGFLLNKSFNFHPSKVKVLFCHIIDLVDLFL